MKTWFITGVSRGIGLALTTEVLRRGDRVIGTTRDGADPDTGDHGGALRIVPLDLARPDSPAAAASAASSIAERIDVVVNNAGYGLLGATEGATDAEVSRLFEVNLFGPFRLIRALLPTLRAQGAGHIVNVTLIAGRAPMASSALYAGAKAAMEAMSHALAQALAPLGIRVTAVAPGGFRTDFLTDHSIRRSDDATSDAYAASVGEALLHFAPIAGRQVGDPLRAAAAIADLVAADDPPVHLLLGSDALRRARERLAADAREIDRWEAVTMNTDYPPATAA